MRTKRRSTLTTRRQANSLTRVIARRTTRCLSTKIRSLLYFFSFKIPLIPCIFVSARARQKTLVWPSICWWDSLCGGIEPIWLAKWRSMFYTHIIYSNFCCKLVRNFFILKILPISNRFYLVVKITCFPLVCLEAKFRNSLCVLWSTFWWLACFQKHSNMFSACLIEYLKIVGIP